MSEGLLQGAGAGAEGGGAEAPRVYGWSAYEDEGFVGAFSTQEEALKDAHESVGKDSDIFIQEGYYGDVSELAPAGNTFVENILDAVQERAYEECGEDAAEGWPDVTQEAETELANEVGNVIKAWMRKHLKMPAWTPVGDPVKFEAAPEET
jgi:hypothetical protein